MDNFDSYSTGESYKTLIQANSSYYHVVMELNMNNLRETL